jgi:16S rRNA (guanine527-N7)-methyltransferase
VTPEGRELLLQGAVELGRPLSQDEVDLLELMADELLRWNRRINLTTITGEREMVARHFLDSLSLFPWLEEAGILLDIGSGGGFPGFPLKVLQPGLLLYSVDSVAKKISFQRHLVRILGFSAVHPLHLRLDGRGDGGIPPCDLVVARALAEAEQVARLARPCLKKGGRLILMKGAEGEEELRRSREGLLGLGFEFGRHRHFTLPVTGDDRHLFELHLQK